MELDTEAMEGAVVDKGYMAQLIEVQRMRGATGGAKFYELLLEGHAAPTQQGWISLITVYRVASKNWPLDIVS